MARKQLAAAVIILFITLSLSAQDASLENSLRNHVAILASDSLSGRAFGFPEKYMAIEYITKQFANAGFVTWGNNYIQSFQQFNGLYLGEGKNIIGLIEGSDPVLKDEYIILGAHYDHMGWRLENGEKVVFNGADDNASGVASVIEIGKILMTKRAALKRSVIIAAFDAEEAGLIGSRMFLEFNENYQSKMKAMFSLDMVGMYSKNNGVNLKGFNSMTGGEDLILKIASDKNVKVVKKSDKIENRTDTWSFGKKNIPAFFITTGLLSPYHKPEDDSDLLDYEGMGTIVNLVSDLVTELTSMDAIEVDKRVISRSVPKETQTVFIGYRLDIGTNYQNYKDQYFRAKPLFSLETGIESQIRLSPLISLQPGFLYGYNGSETAGGAFHIHSVIPHFDILLTTPSDDTEVPFAFFSLGIFHRFNLAASGGATGIDFEEDYNKNETGISFGPGFQAGKLQLALNFKYGLTNINLSEENGDIFNRGTYFSLVKFF
jgi:hypothetical protein